MITETPPTAEIKILLNERLKLKSFVLFFLVVFGIAVDQYVKYLVFSKTVLPSWLLHFRNYQFAFSIPLPVWFIHVLYILVLGVAGYYLNKRFKLAGKIELVGWALLFAGGLSNVGERIVLGYVRDYLLIFNGIFNLADLFIIVGILLIFYGQ